MRFSEPLNERIAAYRFHECSARHRSFRTFAKCIWSYAVWIQGEGRYALLAKCGGLTVTLHKSVDEALKWKQVIDNRGDAKQMTEFLVQYERDPLAWVLYRSDAPDWLWQQVADNTGIPREDDSGARDWVMSFIKQEGITDYTLSGPKPNEILKVQSEID